MADELGSKTVAATIVGPLLWALRDAPEHEWLATGRQLIWQCQFAAAYLLFERARERYPASDDIALAFAGSCIQSQRPGEAENTLAQILSRTPGNAAAVLLLARTLLARGRVLAAAKAFHTFFDHADLDAEILIQAVEMLDDSQRPQDAAILCERFIAAGSVDARIHAYAGMLALQLGEFDRARARYAFALMHASDAVEWSAPLALSTLQHYDSRQHPDLVVFQNILRRPALSSRARAEVFFALGKAHDDLGDMAEASRFYRQANDIMQANSEWSRKNWRRNIEARAAAKFPQIPRMQAMSWAPLFIVGAPRSGSTLLAEHLGRHPQVCARGELPWLARMEAKLAALAAPKPDDYVEAAETYAMHLRQDLPAARWYIDKQPLNFLRIGLAMTLWPEARVIYCQRNPRDTALSIWQQSFSESEYGFSSDFDDIAAFIKGSERMMAHWLEHHPNAIRTIRYEELVANPQAILAQLAQWLDLPTTAPAEDTHAASAIKTASLWQARQPIHTRSIDRWRSYSTWLPELLQFNMQ